MKGEGALHSDLAYGIGPSADQAGKAHIDLFLSFPLQYHCNHLDLASVILYLQSMSQRECNCSSLTTTNVVICSFHLWKYSVWGELTFIASDACKKRYWSPRSPFKVGRYTPVGMFVSAIPEHNKDSTHTSLNTICGSRLLPDVSIAR